MGVNSLSETVTRQRRNCDLNPGPSAPESSTLTTRLPSHHPSHRRYSVHGLSAQWTEDQYWPVQSLWDYESTLTFLYELCRSSASELEALSLVWSPTNKRTEWNPSSALFGKISQKYVASRFEKFKISVSLLVNFELDSKLPNQTYMSIHLPP